MGRLEEHFRRSKLKRRERAIGAQQSAGEIALAFAADERFALPLSVGVYSALRHLPRATRPELLILDGGLSAQSRSRIERVLSRAHPQARWSFVEQDMSDLEGLRTTSHGNLTNYLRLRLPFLAEHRSIILYLDADVLVRRDLSELVALAQEADGQPLSAVRDYLYPSLGSVFGTLGCSQAGLDPDAPYFNSGVLAIHSRSWRRLGISEAALSFPRKHGDLMRLSDQDALNAAAVGRWHELPSAWNVMPVNISPYQRAQRRLGQTVKSRRSMMRDAALIHFVGPFKPWNPLQPSAARLEYVRALIKSGWFDSPQQALVWLVRYIALLPIGITRGVKRWSKRRISVSMSRLGRATASGNVKGSGRRP